jgi:hypothetical protein
VLLKYLDFIAVVFLAVEAISGAYMRKISKCRHARNEYWPCHSFSLMKKGGFAFAMHVISI